VGEIGQGMGAVLRTAAALGCVRFVHARNLHCLQDQGRSAARGETAPSIQA